MKYLRYRRIITSCSKCGAVLATISDNQRRCEISIIMSACIALWEEILTSIKLVDVRRAWLPLVFACFF